MKSTQAVPMLWWSEHTHDGDRRRKLRDRSRAAVWGDGLVDQGLSSLWAAARPDELSEDELVFFIPTSQPHSALASPAIRALLGRGREIARRDADEALADLSIAREGRWDHSILSSRAIFHLSIAAALDIVTGSANDAGHAGVLRATDQIEPTLADALLASVCTCLNCAYVCPRFAFAHELLGAGAWLGHLSRGRPALMPEFVASSLADVLSARIGGQAGEDTSRLVITRVTEHVIGVRRLLRHAEGVLSGGRDLHLPVAPRKSATTPVEPFVWNRDLSRMFSQRTNTRA